MEIPLIDRGALLFTSFRENSYAYRTVEVKEAQKVIERSIQSDPKDAQPHYTLAFTFVVREQFEAAEREAEKASLLAPQETFSNTLKGIIAQLRGDYAAAEREHVAVLDRSTGPDRDGPLGRLADLYGEQGRIQKARANSNRIFIV
jgi:Flp pilus assembly protein TadD